MEICHVLNSMKLPERRCDGLSLRFPSCPHPGATRVAMSVTVSFFICYCYHGTSHRSLGWEDNDTDLNRQLHTTHGDLKVELFCEAAPQTAEVSVFQPKFLVSVNNRYLFAF